MLKIVGKGASSLINYRRRVASRKTYRLYISRLNKKVKWSRYRPGVAQRVGRGIVLLFHDRGTRRGEWSAARPCRTLPRGKTRYPFYRRLGGPQGRSGRVENLVPTGIRSRTVQPVVSRYTDWATRPTSRLNRSSILNHHIRMLYKRDNNFLIPPACFCVHPPSCWSKHICVF